MLLFYTRDLDPYLAEVGRRACVYFHDRLIAPPRRGGLRVDFGLVDNPTRLDSSVLLDLPDADALSALHRRRPVPRQDFRLITSRKTTLDATLLGLARNWVRLASLSSGRLMLVRKHDRAGTIIAWWLGKKLGALRDIPRHQCPWLTDEAQVAPLLKTEFSEIFLQGKAAKLEPIAQVEMPLYLVAVENDARIEPPKSTTSKQPSLSPAAKTMLKTLNARQ